MAGGWPSRRDLRKNDSRGGLLRDAAAHTGASLGGVHVPRRSAADVSHLLSLLARQGSLLGCLASRKPASEHRALRSASRDPRATPGATCDKNDRAFKRVRNA